MAPMVDSSVVSFLDELSSKAPTPGGGSVAALAGALAAGLVGMVCHLTLGKKQYASVEPDMQSLLDEADRLRGNLIALIEDDVEVFGEYSRASKLPRSTEEEKAHRQTAVQTALKAATEVPLQIVDVSVRVMELCRPCAEKGNTWAVSDAGVAVVLAEAAAKSGALNVLINLGSIDDTGFVERKRAELEHLLRGTSDLCDETYDYVVGRL